MSFFFSPEQGREGALSSPATQNCTNYLRRCWFVWYWQEAWTAKLLIAALIPILPSSLSATDPVWLQQLSLHCCFVFMVSTLPTVKILLVSWVWVCLVPGRQRQADHCKSTVSPGIAEHSRPARANRETPPHKHKPNPIRQPPHPFPLYIIISMTHLVMDV